MLDSTDILNISFSIDSTSRAVTQSTPVTLFIYKCLDSECKTCAFNTTTLTVNQTCSQTVTNYTQSSQNVVSATQAFNSIVNVAQFLNPASAAALSPSLFIPSNAYQAVRLSTLIQNVTNPYSKIYLESSAKFFDFNFIQPANFTSYFSLYSPEPSGDDAKRVGIQTLSTLLGILAKGLQALAVFALIATLRQVCEFLTNYGSCRKSITKLLQSASSTLLSLCFFDFIFRYFLVNHFSTNVTLAL